jgi:transposase InsO family protein
VTTLKTAGLSQRRALTTAGVAASTWHYHTHPRPRVVDPMNQRDRAYPNRLSTGEVEAIGARVCAAWDAQHSVDHAFAQAADDGVFLASRRTWWRIAAVTEHPGRPRVPTRSQVRGGAHPKPVLVADGPGQVWSWDITDMKSEYAGVCFKGYSILDVYSRKIPGAAVHDREQEDLVIEMFDRAFAEHGAPKYLHADNGSVMTSQKVQAFLAGHDVTMSHNRPYVSNDNPYSESEFKLMKYRPEYPGTFPSLEDARYFMSGYVAWYNQGHHHSGLAWFTPDQVHDGSWRTVWGVREAALQDYYQAHPERFHRKPKTPEPAGTVGINHKKTDETIPD